MENQYGKPVWKTSMENQYGKPVWKTSLRLFKLSNSNLIFSL